MVFSVCHLSLSKMFWRFIHVVAHMSTYSFFSWIILLHLGCFYFLNIRNKAAVNIYIYRFLYEHVCLLFVGLYLEVALLGHTGMSDCFLQQLHHFTFRPACLRVPFSSTILPTLIIFCLFYYSHPVGMKGISLWKSTIFWCLYDQYWTLNFCFPCIL